MIFEFTNLTSMPVVFCPNPCSNYEDDLCIKYAWIDYDVLRLVYKLAFEVRMGTLNDKTQDGWKLPNVSDQQIIDVLMLLIRLRHWCPITPTFTCGGGTFETDDDPLVIHSIPDVLLIFGCPKDQCQKTDMVFEGRKIQTVFVQ